MSKTAESTTPTLTLRTKLGFLGPARFSPDEHSLVVCNQMEGGSVNNVALHDLVDGGLTSLPEVSANFIMAVAFAPDGGTLATGGAD